MNLIRRLIVDELGPYKKGIVLKVLLVAVIAATPYAFSFLGKWLVDEALQVTGPPTPAAVEAPTAAGDAATPPLGIEWRAKTTPEKLRLLGIFVAASLGLHLLTTGLGGWSEFLNARMVNRMAYELRTRVHEKLENADMTFFAREQVGKLMTRVLDDAGAVPAHLVNLVVNSISQVLMLVLGIVLLVRLNPRMTLVALAALPFYAVACWYFLPRLRGNTEDLRQNGAGMNGYLVERLSAIATIKNYAREPHEIGNFGALVDRQSSLARRQHRLNLGFGTATTLITGIATLSVLAIGFLNIRGGRMQLGEVMAFYQVTAQLFVPITALVGMAGVIQTLRIFADRVYSVLDAPVAIEDPDRVVEPEDLRGEVRFRGVSLRYQEGGPFAVRDVDLEIAAGQTVCFVGPTGCGKSTLISLLTRLYDPTDGQIALDGIDIRQLRLQRLRRAIGNVLRDCRAFTGSIADNLAYGVREADQATLEAAARTVGLHKWIMAQPQGYKTRLGSGGITLDAEQLVRLNLARALVTEPAVLTIDDTFATVDEAADEELRAVLHEHLAERTVLMATSRLAACADADLVVVLQAGRIVQAGTHRSLLAEAGLYRRMYRRQMGLAEPA